MRAGAGNPQIRKSYIHGSSDANGGYVCYFPVTPETFGATLFHALKVAPEIRLGADGVIHPVSAGLPVVELFR